MESGLRVFLLGPASKIAVLACATLALQGCGLFGGSKEEPPLGSETEPESTGPDASEQPVINPDVARRRIKVPRIDNENWEIGISGGLISIEDFGSSPVYGARLGYHLTEDFFLEATAGYAEGGTTSYENLAGGPQLLTDADREYLYGALNVGWNILPGEIFIGKGRAYNTHLYLTAGMGVTEFASDIHYTANFGAGYRILFTDWIAARLDFRDYLFDSDLLGSKKVTNNLEATLGITFFF